MGRPIAGRYDRPGSPLGAPKAKPTAAVRSTAKT